ncbi:hypothetical protein TWF506_006954 [Arthrobotrys conoides]|uniref:F-box domain-containing protein n=1 Tax=Arthrobotrys conoides TaxID=74498 RepID=A0AAN8NHP1_9PEZI
MATESPRRLIDLSDDVLRLIFQHNVSFKDLKSLRFVHSSLHGAVDPLLFKSIILPTEHPEDESNFHNSERTSAQSPSSAGYDFQYPSFKVSTRQLSSILERRVPSVVTDNAQTVILRQYDVYEGYPDETKMKQNFPQHSEEGIRCLEHFLCGMKKMRNLTWNLACSNITRQIDLSPIAGKVDNLFLAGTDYGKIQPPVYSYKAFKDFTSLTSLAINFYDSADVKDLSYFPHLKTLNFTMQHTPTPNLNAQRKFDFVDFLEAQRVPFSLQTLSLSACYSRMPISQDLAQKFFLNLQTLYLRYLDPEAESYGIIDALKENSIKIRELNIDGCHSSIIDYLGSYTGTLQSFRAHVERLKDNEGFDDEEDHWDIRRRHRWHESEAEKLKETFKSDIWKVLAAAHKHSLQHLVLSNNFKLYFEEAEALSQCKAMRTMDIKGDDWVFLNIVPVASNLPLLESLKFEIPWTPRKPDMSGWCGTSQYEWYKKPKDIDSRVRAMHWREEDIKAVGPAAKNLTFRIPGIPTDLKLVRRRDIFYPWILVGGGEMGIEGREGQGMDSDEEEEYEDSNDE